MAEETREANVVLTANTTQYSQQMASASMQTTQASTAVDKLINSLDRLQRSVSRKLDIISAASIAGITAATLSAAKFESQLETLQATAAITGKSFASVEKSVDGLRRSLPVSTDQVVQLVNALQKMGVSTPKVRELAETFIKLGAATGEDIGQLATGLVGLQRAMGTTEGSIKSFSDSAAHLSATMGVSATGILQFAQQLAPVARTVGMTQTQVMGFSTAFLKAGQDGYAAANVFSKLLTDISRATRYGSNDIYAYANAVGMTAEQFKKLPAAEQATQFFSAVSRQGADAIKTLERLGYDGPRALKAIQGMAQSGALGRSLGEAERGFNSNATETGAKAAMDGLNDSLKKLQNTLTSIGQTFGKTFLPYVKMAVDVVNTMAGAVRGLMEPLSNMLSKFAVLGTLASGLASVATTGVGLLAAAGGAYALFRNPLTAGFMSRRAERTGGRMSRFTENTAANMATRGSPMQQRFFGWGRGAAGILVGDRGGEMGPQISPWRRARLEMRQGLAQMYKDAVNVNPPGFYRGTDPLLPGQMRMGPDGQPLLDDKGMPRRRFAWTGMRFGHPGGPDLLPEREAGDTFRRGLHLRGLGARAAMGVSGVYQGALGMMRSQIDPIRWAGSMDASARPGYSWAQTGDTLRRAWTGEGAGVAKSMQLMQQANIRFIKSLGDATLGLGRLSAQAIKAAGAPMIRSAMSNVGSVAKGAMALAGGPIGLTIMGATALGGWAASRNQAAQDFRERLGANTAEDSAVNKYATAMGLAGSAAMSFADSVTKANAIIVSTAERARLVNANDIKAAQAQGRKVTNKELEGMTKEQAQQYATSVFGVGGVDPKIMQEMKLDILDVFGVGEGKNIIKKASAGEKVDLGQMVEGYRSGLAGEGKGDVWSSFRPSKNLLDSLSQVESEYSTTAGYLNTQFGEEETKKFTASTVNTLLSKITGNTSEAQAQAIASTVEAVIGEGKLNLGMGDLEAFRKAEGTQAKNNVLMNAIRVNEAAGGGGGDWLAAYESMGAERQYTSYSIPKASLESSLYTDLGVYGTKAGAVLKSNIGTGRSINQALAAPEDANLQLQAATQWGQELTKMTGSTVAANLELQNLKARVNDVNDPLYQMAAAAQQAAQRLQGYASRYQGAGENARVTAGNLATAYVAQGPDRMQNIIAAEDAYESARSGLYEQFKTIVKAYKEFDIQQGRSQADFNKQRARSDKDYALQRKYGEQDYYQSKQRAQESFDKQRRRSEEDYQHGIEQQIKSNAKTMQNVYERITTKPSWDAKNLLTNSNDQLAKMRQQQADLARVREMGLSGDAINQLGLNEFGNQQQLARLVGDLANSPELIAQWNEAVKGKLDISKAFVTDQDSESWKEMERQYQLSLTRMSEDFTLMNAQGEADYKKTLDRQNLAYAESMKRTGADFRQQMAQAREDLNRSFEETTGSFTEMADKALGSLTGVTKSQYTELNTALGMSREEIQKALQGTTEDMIKLLAPLFGGEEAARKALASAANQKTITSPSAEWNRSQALAKQGKGGPGGSEHSYDSMSSGAHGGAYGTGGANFPLPVGQWTKTSNFGMRSNPVTGVYRLHAGTDLAARQGTPIGASEDGIVTKAGVMGGLGNMVELTHGGGTKTWYGHMSMITTKVGDMVGAGTQIGLVGSTGNSTGPHLHFERHINGQAVDPWGYLQGLQSGEITGGIMSGLLSVPGVMGAGKTADVSKIQSVMDAEKAFSSMVPGGMTYTPGMFPTALQTRVSSLLGVPQDSIGGGTGSYGTSPSGRVGARGGYARGGVVMDTKSVTNIQHIDNGTDFNGGIVVVAQDPEEMGRKLAEKKRMKALTRPTRSN